ncbi:dethiobiotin synthase [uncultured Ruminococcus sp.]|uniref:dethiobiotin synthase n=1 Tax=uncultured Ruminococcus sp. TaxID=165186 RepID=UPI0025E23DAB|nr:dethiobiotin synthase [uncultured Ruminococcus sp.]
MRKAVFMTGTGTDVGKTYVTALLVKKLKERGYDPAYYKAAVSGNTRGADGRLIAGDALYVKNISGIDQPLDEMCPYIYERAVSPHLAAQIEGGPVDMETVRKGFEKACETHGCVVMEGSGGIVCPIRCDDKLILLEDIIKTLGLSCIITADAGLGTINSVVLTAEYMRRNGIKILGVILNNFHAGDVMEEDNRVMCEIVGGVKIIGTVAPDATDIDMTDEALDALFCEEE